MITLRNNFHGTSVNVRVAGDRDDYELTPSQTRKVKRAHCLVDPKDLREASKAGWESGARGPKSPTSMWAHYGRVETQDAFWNAYEAGRKARKEFLRCLSSK